MKLNGKFPDQRGIVRRGKIVGYNGNGVPFRRYTWIKAELPDLNGKEFDATDTQIEHARKNK